MTRPSKSAPYAVRFYARLLRLYPRSYREAFGAHMLQTFKDHYTDVVAHAGKAGLSFWLGVVSDAVTSISCEYLAQLKGGERTMNKYGFGLALGIVMSVAVIMTNVVFPNQE